MQTCDPYVDDSKEDVHNSNCFKELNKEWVDTRDSSGAHRYHQSPVAFHANYPNVSDFGTKLAHDSVGKMKILYGFPVVSGESYISNSSVAFHRFLRGPDDMRRLDLLLYDSGIEQCKGTGYQVK